MKTLDISGYHQVERPVSIGPNVRRTARNICIFLVQPIHQYVLIVTKLP